MWRGKKFISEGFFFFWNVIIKEKQHFLVWLFASRKFAVKKRDSLAMRQGFNTEWAHSLSVPYTDMGRNNNG